MVSSSNHHHFHYGYHRFLWRTTTTMIISSIVVIYHVLILNDLKRYYVCANINVPFVPSRLECSAVGTTVRMMRLERRMMSFWIPLDHCYYYYHDSDSYTPNYYEYRLYDWYHHLHNPQHRHHFLDPLLSRTTTPSPHQAHSKVTVVGRVKAIIMKDISIESFDW